MIEESGIRILKDDTVTIGDFLLAGRDDYRQHKDRAQAAELVQDTNRFVVMIDHQPVQSEQVREAGADLMMSDTPMTASCGPWLSDPPASIHGSGIRHPAGGWLYADHLRRHRRLGFPVRTAGQSEYVVVDVKPEEKS